MAAQVFDSADAVRAFVGQPGVSGSPRLVDQDMIGRFAEVTHDQQWIHVDPERAARESPFGTTVAHGLLTLSLVPAWFTECFEFRNRQLALNYGYDKIRFTGVVPSGSWLVGDFQLDRIEPAGTADIRCFWKTTVRLVDAVKPVMVATWITQLRFNASSQ